MDIIAKSSWPSVCNLQPTCVMQAPVNATITATTLTVSWNCRNLEMLSYTFLPHMTALTMLVKLSSVRMMSEASFATSVPAIPWQEAKRMDSVCLMAWDLREKITGWDHGSRRMVWWRIVRIVDGSTFIVNIQTKRRIKKSVPRKFSVLSYVLKC